MSLRWPSNFNLQIAQIVQLVQIRAEKKFEKKSGASFFNLQIAQIVQIREKTVQIVAASCRLIF